MFSFVHILCFPNPSLAWQDSSKFPLVSHHRFSPTIQEKNIFQLVLVAVRDSVISIGHCTHLCQNSKTLIYGSNQYLYSKCTMNVTLTCCASSRGSIPIRVSSIQLFFIYLFGPKVVRRNQTQLLAVASSSISEMQTQKIILSHAIYACRGKIRNVTKTMFSW